MVNYRKLAGSKIGNYTVRQLTNDAADIIATYEGFQQSLNRRVMVQILNPELSLDKDIEKGFIKSAEIMAQLEHPNIAPVYDTGSYNGFAFIILRWMDGGSLIERMNNGWKITQLDTINIVKDIARALDFAHSQGVIHTDPYLDNILFDKSDNAYIGNFHVAGMNVPSKSDFGSHPFAAPEVFPSGIRSDKTDQHALAAIATILLIGDMVFANSVSRPSEINRKLELSENIPFSAVEVLQRGMSVNPRDRYPTVVDFARELDIAIQEKPRHLFISYSRRDAEYAMQLRKYMTNNGFNVWIDDAIEHGDDWFQQINEAIESSAAVLVIMTPESEKSEWVHKEILLAKRYQKPIFPLLLEGAEFPILIDIQYADVRDTTMPGTDFHRRVRRVVYGQI